jgi:hypothetical protein
MRRFGIVWAAIAVYLVVLGCVLLPSDAPAKQPYAHSERPNGAPNPSRADLPYRSITMQLQRTDWIDKYEKSIDEIAAIGADTVQFVVDPRMENGAAGRIYLDMRMTPTPDMLARLIKHAKDKNLRVTLMPIVLMDKPRGDEWRGKISPSADNGGWDEWFDSYREMIKHFAWIAESNHVDLLVVGSELVSTESKLEQWTKTIDLVRGIFHGRLTYSSNWDHYTSVPFWDQLDLIGMNSYWSFGDRYKNPDPSVEHIVKRWREIQSDLLPFQKKVGKPIIFLEIGWYSQDDVAYEPWDYTQEDHAVDVDLQRKLYQGFFEAWYGDPRLGGFSVWEWPPGDGGPEDHGYTPEGKPAEKVLREWLGKPKWKVQ